MAKGNFVIVTGLSGAGRSTALKNLEDLGYFCVDNLPTTLIPKFAEICLQLKDKIKKVALGIDIREGDFLDDLFGSLEELGKMGFSHQILFLEASNSVLVRRYSETRRKHPLDREGRSMLEVIIKERKRLMGIKERADKIIDTTALTPQEFKQVIFSSFRETAELDTMNVSLVSFGYKYGIPVDADLVIDTRFLPNPHYIERLRPLTGNNPEVSRFVLRSSVTQKFLRKYFGLLKFLIPYYIREGKSYLTIAVGCTGGRHRSVIVVNELKKFLEKKYPVKTQYRDIEKSTV
ncbi:RNase adapter RapZ [bacterium]|nr:RNase adapter RapZ [bacterium]NIN92411.1 RNase adapter RapZ [bacterium]NIO18525.1 RNase adapter RapZ [bacterium]NIO73521.1 RNase adapter RapZ [bacterium]